MGGGSQTAQPPTLTVTARIDVNVSARAGALVGVGRVFSGSTA
jgi:hypothetical protein